MSPSAHQLLDLDDSALAVIDIQSGFVDRLEPDRQEPFLARAAWLVAVAARVGVPVLATVENPGDMGGVHDTIAEHLPPGTSAHDKTAFGLCGDAPLLDTLRQMERRQVVLIGMETDVCIAQSALGLAGEGFQPYVAADATASSADAHEHGLERLRGAGIPVVSVKGVFMEWVRRPDACRRFEAEHPDLFTNAPVLI